MNATDAAAILGIAPTHRPSRGAYETGTSISGLGTYWEVIITYNASPGGKGYTPPGDRQIDPDYGPEIEIVSVELTAYYDGSKMVTMPSPLLIDWAELDAERQCAIEDTCAAQYEEDRP